MALTPLSDALATLLAQIDSTPQTEWVSLEASSGRYAAEAVHSTLSVPPADNSAMDGYAVRTGDILAITQRKPKIRKSNQKQIKTRWRSQENFSFNSMIVK